MSETSTSASFMRTSGECASKPPLSSDSSIDSGCSAMTASETIHVNQPPNVTPKLMGSNNLCHQRRQAGSRISLSMLPPQPLVPPPPPPSQLQEVYYEAANIHQNHLSVAQQQPDKQDDFNGNNNSGIYPKNVYATYSQGMQPVKNITTQDTETSKNDELHNNSVPSNSSHKSRKVLNRPLSNQRSSTSSLESASSVPLMPMNVKGMLLHGVPSEEVMRTWLASIKCDEHIESFTYHGYDIHLVTRMTPQDLAAVGCKSPASRKKLLSEIKKLNLEYEPPDFDSSNGLGCWLEALSLSQYNQIMKSEGYESMDKISEISWEDLEEIGITKLGHQKKLLLAVEKMRKMTKHREECQNDNAIYDVHPNHRISLNGSHQDHRMGTLGRVRSGFFQTRSGANLDHRGLPVATVMPAMKHVMSPVMQTGNGQSTTHKNGGMQDDSTQIYGTNGNSGNNLNPSSNRQQIYGNFDTSSQMEILKLNDLSLSGTNMRRVPAPLPPVRTNSLKVSQDDVINANPVYGNNFGTQNEIYGVATTNSTSFLRIPKLGALTATTTKMLASGGHLQTISAEQANSGTRIVPVREAPLPPVQQAQLSYQQNTLRAIPHRIDEEPSIGPMTHQQGHTNFPMPFNCDGSQTFMNVMGDQLADANEFPPPPPCQ